MLPRSIWSRMLRIFIPYSLKNRVPFGELADLRKKRTCLKIPAVMPPRRKGIVMDAHSQQGIWYELKPKKLAKKDRKHPWLFAEYLEFPSQREDGNDYLAFLFRNEDRTVFGVKEYWDLHTDDLRDLATHVVLDAEFRKSLISDDPMLPKMWKKR